MKHTRFVLTGGLGNQLFQFASALSHSLSAKTSIELESVLGKPRGQKNNPDLFRFDLPDAVKHISESLLVNRALGFSLRISLRAGTSNPRRLRAFLSKFILSCLVSIRLLNMFRVKSPGDLGFDADLKIRKSGDLVIGYFQSYKYANENSLTRRYLLNLKLAGEDPIELANLRKLSQIEKPLVVHIRRGDYRQEDAFGLLSSDYYFSMIPEILTKGEFNKIWLFSDDLPVALECIPIEFRGIVRQIAEINRSPAATLEAMRLGHGYVIANSSFSWWGAFLSYQPDVQVHAPWPWFKGMESPKELLPPEWIPHLSKWE